MSFLVDSVSRSDVTYVLEELHAPFLWLHLACRCPSLCSYRMLIVSKTLFDCLQRRFQYHRGAATQMNGTWEEVELCEINPDFCVVPSLSSLGRILFSYYHKLSIIVVLFFFFFFFITSWPFPFCSVGFLSKDKINTLVLVVLGRRRKKKYCQIFYWKLLLSVKHFSWII